MVTEVEELVTKVAEVVTEVAELVTKVAEVVTEVAELVTEVGGLIPHPPPNIVDAKTMPPPPPPSWWFSGCGDGTGVIEGVVATVVGLAVVTDRERGGAKA